MLARLALGAPLRAARRLARRDRRLALLPPLGIPGGPGLGGLDQVLVRVQPLPPAQDFLPFGPDGDDRRRLPSRSATSLSEHDGRHRDRTRTYPVNVGRAVPYPG